MIKGDLSAKISELLDDCEIRFRIGDDELDVERVEIDGDMDESWIVLAPKAETEDETGPYYIGRHRKTD